MIIVNPADNSATNSMNKQSCTIVWTKGKSYTNAAGLIALEQGICYTNDCYCMELRVSKFILSKRDTWRTEIRIEEVD